MGLRTNHPMSTWGHRTLAEGCLRGMDRESIRPSAYSQKLEVKANARLGWQPM